MAGGFKAEAWVIALIALAVAVGLVRLVLWRRSVAVATRGPVWRMTALIALQAMAGLLLYLTLFPPKAMMSPGRLVVATGGGVSAIVREPGDILVALPEARMADGVARAPDLGTALRRYPEAGRLLIVGEGLVPRDQLALDRISAFTPPPMQHGLISLTLPEQVAPGARFSVSGQIGTQAAGVMELVDPSNAVVDRQSVTANTRFHLSANTRAPGPALFDLRLRDKTGRLVEHISVPVDTRAQRQPRVLVLAGAPSAETKYLKRWAEDAGVDLDVQIELGAGVQLGGPATPLSRAALADIDLVVIDDRRWETLNPDAKATLAAATRAGLGLLLRPTGPLSASTRRDWADLGVMVGGGDTTQPLRLAQPSSGPTTGRVDDKGLTLNRRDILHEAPGAVSMVRDAEGIALASWRPLGLGRIGLWTVTDSYILILTGRTERYSDLWSELFSALARPGLDSGLRLEGLTRQGARIALCRVSGQLTITAPDGGERSARVDPATGDQACAAYWPDRSGWHLARAGGQERAFYVHPADTAPSLTQAANREATIALVEAAPASARQAGRRAPSSPWPWSMALMVALGLLWWLERRPHLST